MIEWYGGMDYDFGVGLVYEVGVDDVVVGGKWYCVFGFEMVVI